jgi:hypothetical protein
MVTNDALRKTVVKVFDACAHAIYIAKILRAKKLCIDKRSVVKKRVKDQCMSHIGLS